MLPTLSAIFVGGNPLVGGMGTVIGAIIGSFTTSFIETGIIAAGFDEFFTRFVHGVVLIVVVLNLIVLHDIYNTVFALVGVEKGK